MTQPSHKPAPCADDESKKAGFETSDVQARNVALAVVALFTTVAVSFGIVAGIVWVTTPEAKAPSSVLDTVDAKEGVRLEVDPQGDRRALQLKAEARIESYGWTDEKAGLARIPIERAMALVATRGWPDQQAAPAGNENGMTP